jgi:hypothetical protein
MMRSEVANTIVVVKIMNKKKMKMIERVDIIEKKKHTMTMKMIIIKKVGIIAKKIHMMIMIEMKNIIKVVEVVINMMMRNL